MLHNAQSNLHVRDKLNPKRLSNANQALAKLSEQRAQIYLKISPPSSVRPARCCSSPLHELGLGEHQPEENHFIFGTMFHGLRKRPIKSAENMIETVQRGCLIVRVMLRADDGVDAN